MKCLIDADSMLYIIGWNCKDLDFDMAGYESVINQTDSFVKTILAGCKATEYLGFLGGGAPTFRHIYTPSYKGNRGAGKPEWFAKWSGVIKQRLTQYWGFETVNGIEAEDAVGMIAFHLYKKAADVTIAHIDKDLNQIPGDHFNYKTHAVEHITYKTAKRNLFFQVLTGDTTDNIKGLVGCGKVGANKILTEAEQENKEYSIKTLEAYIDNYGEREGINQFTENYTLVKLLDVVPAELSFDVNNFVYKTYNLTAAQEKSSAFVNNVSTYFNK